MKLHQTAITLFISWLGFYAAVVNANTAALADEIKVVGLFKNAAVISINDQREVIRVGDKKHNLRLLAADSDKALIEYHGQRMLS